MGTDYTKTLKEEAATWLITDPIIRSEKAQRERIRYPMMKKQMGLEFLDTHDMEVWDVGAGPLGGVSSVIQARSVLRLDPLANEYGRFFPIDTYINIQAEKATYSKPDLVIITNALDHCENPLLVLDKLNTEMKYGSYFAHYHAINNAITHPHIAHKHNVNPLSMNRLTNFECVWSLDYTHDNLVYGWRKQPAFCGLFRKIC